MDITLKIISNDQPSEVLCDLKWENGCATINRAAACILPDIIKFIKFGLDDYFEEIPRHTDPESQEFLPRLKEYLEKQFNFQYDLEYTIDV